jgi:uncharacterized protein YaeQ
LLTREVRSSVVKSGGMTVAKRRGFEKSSSTVARHPSNAQRERPVTIRSM